MYMSVSIVNPPTNPTLSTLSPGAWFALASSLVPYLVIADAGDGNKYCVRAQQGTSDLHPVTLSDSLGIVPMSDPASIVVTF